MIRIRLIINNITKTGVIEYNPFKNKTQCTGIEKTLLPSQLSNALGALNYFAAKDSGQLATHRMSHYVKLVNIQAVVEHLNQDLGQLRAQLLEVGEGIEHVVAIGQFTPVEDDKVGILSLQIGLGYDVNALHIRILQIAMQIENCILAQVQVLILQKTLKIG